MALNKYMHPRNAYKTRKPNFKELAIKYPEFREKVTQNLNGKVILDFKDPEALRALTTALLRDDFDLNVSLPTDRLIPTVPQRLNYILWLEDIFDLSKDLKGIDIGVGASCIYPLLGCKQNAWSFLASEVDDQNLMFARKNIQQNNMEHKIRVKKVPEDTLLIGLVEENMTYDFCMCNPPFYSDHLEAQGISTSRSDDRPEPMSLSTASEIESISWGGEVNFVTKMIEESLVLKNRIRVYTSLLGKKMNLSLLKDELTRRKITKFSSTEFCQGRTMRWGLAWTFDDSVKFPKSAFKSLKNIKPPLMYTISRDNPVVSDYTVQAFTKYMKDAFDEFKIKYNIIHSGKFYTAMNLQAKENTWSHQRRKRRQKLHDQSEDFTPVTESDMKETEQHCEIKDTESADTCKVNRAELNCADKIPVADQSEVVLDSNSHNNLNLQLKNIGDNAKSETSSSCLASKRKCELLEGSAQESKKKKVDVMNSAYSGNTFKDTNQEINETNKTKVCLEDKKKVENSNSDFESKIEITEKKSVLHELADTEATVNKLESSDIVGNNSSEQVTDEKLSSSTINQVPDKISEDAAKEFKEAGANHLCPENYGDGNPGKIKTNMPTCTKDIHANPSCTGDKLNSSDSGEVTHLRKDVLEEFHKEKEKNVEIELLNKDQTKTTKYHNFDENEECLVMVKMILRKEDGIITLTMEYKSGNKEAMHQIMQYFKNKFTVVST